MVVDYSKFDSIEVSDDSDIEVHPNVDKKSFIRAKQSQIHQQRQQRRYEIETLKYERIINDGLLERINSLLAALKKHQNESGSRNPDELVFQSLIESAGDPAKDEPPRPPENVYTKQQEVPKFSKMMGSLVDQVKKDIDENNDPNRMQAFIDGVGSHLTKVQDLQQELLKKLASLEKEESSKITSDSIRTGFSSSSITKSPAPAPSTKVELLNPSRSASGPMDSISSGAEADSESGDPDADIQPTALGKLFAAIPPADYRASLAFISQHPDIVSERETDGLLVAAFNAAMENNPSHAHTCVHQALLLQYCRNLGRDGVGLFFKRITTVNHRARTVFLDDVNSTWTRIKTRAAELLREQKAEGEGVETIQLHAVDPNTTIHIVVPPPVVDTAGGDDSKIASDSNTAAAGAVAPTREEAIARREIFEAFPTDLKKALEQSSLDAVNEVLGKMSVDEAEEVVRLMGEGDMLNVEEGVLDATTEEGRERLKEIEEERALEVKEGKGKGKMESVEEVEEKPGDPE